MPMALRMASTLTMLPGFALTEFLLRAHSGTSIKTQCRVTSDCEMPAPKVSLQSFQPAQVPVHWHPECGSGVLVAWH